MQKKKSVIGTSPVRKDALNKVLGMPEYAADMDKEGQLYAATLRSPYPAAKIIKIDAKEATAMCGVECVLTSKDVLGENRVGIIFKDEFLLAEDEVRRIGDPIAIVAAATQEIAEAAVKAINVEYEVLEPIFTIEEARLPNARSIHPNGNLCLHKHLEIGNVDEALCRSDVVVEETYKTPILSHMFLETEAGLAFIENGLLTVYCCAQNVHFVRNEIARTCGLPMNRVRVIQTVTGGGFGGKLDVSFQCHIAMLCLRTGKPVKLVRNRKESTLASSKRHPFVIKARTGATKNGNIIACDVQMWSDGGAYASYAPAVASRAIMHFMGPYDISNVRGDLKIYYTNNPTCGAFRGFGMPQVAVCHEGQINALSRALHMDPIELRMINALKKGSYTASGQCLYDNISFVETLTSAREKAMQVMDKGMTR